MKKLRLLVIFSITVISLFALSISGEAACGDVNNDGIYSTDDAILTLGYAASTEIPDEAQQDAADVIHDGIITTDDAVEILRIATGITKAPTHLYSGWQVITDSTCTQTGTSSCFCLICDEVFYGTVPKKDHQYTQGKCSLCGHLAEAPYVTYRGHTINFGDSTASVSSKLGSPQDTLSDTDIDSNEILIFVYCDDYDNLGIFTFTNGLLTQFYTNNAANTITHNRAVYDLNDSNPSGAPEIHLSDELYVTQYVDTHATNGAYVYAYTATAGSSYTFANYTNKDANERLIAHITNGLRAIHGKNALKYCTMAGSAAYKHSSDMATRNYFDHYTPEGLSPSDRLTAEGIRWLGFGENIAAGYADAYDISNGWYNSAGHRSNLLSNHHEYIGVGLARDYDSKYRYYGTQNFYSD